MKRFWWVLISVGLLAGPAVSLAAAQPQPSPDEFVPVSEAPAGEQIPAITLVASAYGFVWVVLVGYTWTLASRLRKVERDIGELEQRGR